MLEFVWILFGLIVGLVIGRWWAFLVAVPAGAIAGGLLVKDILYERPSTLELAVKSLLVFGSVTAAGVGLALLVPKALEELRRDRWP